MCHDLLFMLQPNTLTYISHYDVQSCSPDIIFNWGIQQQEKVPVNLEHCHLMIYVY